MLWINTCLVRRYTLRFRKFRGLLWFWLDNTVPSYRVQSGLLQILSKTQMQFIVMEYCEATHFSVYILQIQHQDLYILRQRDKTNSSFRKEPWIKWGVWGCIEVYLNFYFLDLEDCLGVHHKGSLKEHIVPFISICKISPNLLPFCYILSNSGKSRLQTA